MVDPKVIHDQLKAIKFGASPWNQAEIKELPNIIHQGETISECVNGLYEGGVALLVATEMRVLLIDKKPLGYLNVEDLRFDMINEIDYSHRLINATITITTGNKTLRFKSYNQARLRHLIGLVQEHMSSNKRSQSDKIEEQKQHLEEINKQLQMYLMAQHQQLQRQVEANQNNNSSAGSSELPKPSPQLSDFLFAQRLLDQFQKENGGKVPTTPLPEKVNKIEQKAEAGEPKAIDQAEIIDDARKEVFGKVIQQQQPSDDALVAAQKNDDPKSYFTGIEVSPLRIAYSKLPMMLRNRKFGRSSPRRYTEQSGFKYDHKAAQ